MMPVPKLLASPVLGFCEQHSHSVYSKLTSVKGETHCNVFLQCGISGNIMATRT